MKKLMIYMFIFFGVYNSYFLGVEPERSLSLNITAPVYKDLSLSVTYDKTYSINGVVEHMFREGLNGRTITIGIEFDF